MGGKVQHQLVGKRACRLPGLLLRRVGIAPAPAVRTALQLAQRLGVRAGLGAAPLDPKPPVRAHGDERPANRLHLIGVVLAAGAFEVGQPVLDLAHTLGALVGLAVALGFELLVLRRQRLDLGLGLGAERRRRRVSAAVLLRQRVVEGQRHLDPRPAFAAHLLGLDVQLPGRQLLQQSHVADEACIVRLGEEVLSNHAAGRPVGVDADELGQRVRLGIDGAADDALLELPGRAAVGREVEIGRLLGRMILGQREDRHLV